MPQTLDLLEKSALIFLYNFHRKHSFLKLIIKKLSPKINVKNIKNRVYIGTVSINCAPEMSEIDCIGRIESFWPKFGRGW